MKRIRTELLAGIAAGLIALALIMALVGYAILPASAQAPAYVEVDEARTRTSKTYQDTDNETRYRSVFYLDDIHYKADEWDEDEPWKDIDENIAISLLPGWDYEVTRGKWQMYIREDTTVACGRYGHWQRMRLEGVAYLDRATKEYVILDTRSDNVTPIADNNTIKWAGIFNNVDLEYIYTASKFRAVLTLSEAGRTWASNNPPSKYGLSNQTSYLTFYATVDYAQAFDAVDDEGNAVDWNTAREYESGGVSFLHPTKNVVIARLMPNKAYVEGDYVTQPVPIVKRYIKKGANTYLLFGAKVATLNQLPAGAIVFDPDTFYPDADPENGSCDGTTLRDSNGAWTTFANGNGTHAFPSTNPYGLAAFTSLGGGTYTQLHRGQFIFETASLDDDITIYTANISFVCALIFDQLPYDGLINIYEADVQNNDNIVPSDHQRVGSTEFSTGVAITTGFTLEEREYFDLNADGRANVNLTGTSEYSGRLEDDADDIDPNAGAGSEILRVYMAEEAGTSKDPTLEVDWSPPPSSPDVLNPPTPFTVVDMGGNTANVTWGYTGNTTTAHIMMGRAPDFATSVNETGFELIYQGGDNETTISGLSLATTNYTLAAWGGNSTHLSEDNATATIGGEDMEAIGEGITYGVVAFIVVCLTGLAFVVRSQALYILAAFALLSFGFYIYDLHAGISFVCGLFGVLVFILAFVGKTARGKR